MKKWCLIIWLALLIITGCGSTAQKPDYSEPSKNQVTVSERRVLAVAISEKAEKVKGVITATVIIPEIQLEKARAQSDQKDGSEYSNMVVMVGLTIDNKIQEDKKKVENINKQVEKTIREDNKVSKVLVTSDPDLVEIIKNIAAGEFEGKSIDDFDKDIKKLYREI
ncbi:MAG: YhcN/YlaJ family sporulation lipoprotein [Syntrophomonadaceae bacterium]|jgi:hypothetical protein